MSNSSQDNQSETDTNDRMRSSTKEEQSPIQMPIVPQLGEIEITNSLEVQSPIISTPENEKRVSNTNSKTLIKEKTNPVNSATSNPKVILSGVSDVRLSTGQDNSSIKEQSPLKKKSRLMFDDSADDNLTVRTEDEQKAQKLLRTRRQSRGAIDMGNDISLAVPGKSGKDKMQQISEKIAQKVKVENLVRNLKTTELEKFAKNKSHSVFLQKVAEDTKREMNVSIYYQLLRETLDVLESTNQDYERNLGHKHSITRDIQDRTFYIDDILETQELNQGSPVSNNIFAKVANDMTRGISRMGRASQRLGENRNSSMKVNDVNQQRSKLSLLFSPKDEHTVDGVGSFRKSYVATHLSPNMYIIVTIVTVITTVLFVQLIQ